jgi:uncharacterized protein DUF4157
MLMNPRRTHIERTAARDDGAGRPIRAEQNTAGLRNRSSYLRGKLQAPAAIGPDNNPLEDEADRIAHQAILPGHLPIDKPTAHPSVPSTPAGHMNAAPASVERVIAGTGTSLDPALRQDMEQRFHRDFSRVQVHRGPEAEQSARDVSARAYTVGSHIAFAAGSFSPETVKGRRLLAHELAHVAQQATAPESGTAHLQRQHEEKPEPKGPSTPPLKVMTKPPPTQLSREEIKQTAKAPERKADDQPVPAKTAAPTEKKGKPPAAAEKKEESEKTELSIGAGVESEISKHSTENVAKLSFEAVFPLSSWQTDRFRLGAPLKFFNEFSLEPSVGLKQQDAVHWLTPAAVEGSLKMISIEWESLTKAGVFKTGLGVSAVGSSEYTPQTKELKVEGALETGAELEYRHKKESHFFLKIEAKGQLKYGGTPGSAEFGWEGASFSTGATVGYSF